MVTWMSAFEGRRGIKLRITARNLRKIIKEEILRSRLLREYSGDELAAMGTNLEMKLDKVFEKIKSSRDVELSDLRTKEALEPLFSMKDEQIQRIIDAGNIRQKIKDHYGEGLRNLFTDYDYPRGQVESRMSKAHVIAYDMRQLTFVKEIPSGPIFSAIENAAKKEVNQLLMDKIGEEDKKFYDEVFAIP